MSTLKIALIQVAYEPGAMEEKYRTLVREAARGGAELVVLPELSLLPYLAAKSRGTGEAEVLPESVPQGDSCRFFAELAKENGVFVIGSVYERGGLGFRKQKGARFNMAAIMDKAGALGGGCRKTHIALNPYEAEYYSAGNSDYPLFKVGEAFLAMPTGEDLWFPELARVYALKGAGVIAAPAAVGSRAEEKPFNSPEAWGTMVRSHAVANGVFVAVANRVGKSGECTFHGSSMIVAPGGTVLAQGTADQEEVIAAEVDLEQVAAWRKTFPLLLRREPQTYGIVMARLTEEETKE